MTGAEPLEVQVTFDCADPARLMQFWCAALGYEPESPPAGYATWADALDAWGVPAGARNDRSAAVDPSRRGPRLFFQKVPEAKQVKNRLHLDLRAAPGLEGSARASALEAKSEELVALGARLVRRSEPSAFEGGYLVMQDPEGNEFCLD